MNNEVIVYPDYGNSINTVLYVYGGGFLGVIAMAIYTFTHV